MRAVRPVAQTTPPDTDEPGPGDAPGGVHAAQGVLLPALVPDPPPLVPIPTKRFDWEKFVREWPVTKPMTPAVKLVALVCATYADADGRRVRPGESGLAEACGMGGSTVRRHLATLVAIGLLVCVRRGGGGMASEYRLTVPEGRQLRSLR